MRFPRRQISGSSSPLESGSASGIEDTAVNDWQHSRVPKTASTLKDFRRQLQEMLPATADVKSADRFEDLIPIKDRRRVWEDLQAVGFTLLPLVLSRRVMLIAWAIVLGPVVLLALAFRTASIVLSVVELWILAYRLTRPLAVYPPASCENVREAVLHVTRFTLADYKAGLWPREEIAAKVRIIIARNCGVRFDDVHDDSCLICGLTRRTGTQTHRHR
jgi:hypothetical protein